VVRDVARQADVTSSLIYPGAGLASGERLCAGADGTLWRHGRRHAAAARDRDRICRPCRRPHPGISVAGFAGRRGRGTGAAVVAALDGHRFRRQVPFGQYIADFVCHDARLIVEIDGGQHERSSPDETKRTRFLENQGYRFLRF
jgi:hypothetical protein